MKQEIENLLNSLKERHGSLGFTEEIESLTSPNQKAFSVIREYLHFISLCLLKYYLEKNIYAKEISDLAIKFLFEPSLENIINFQSSTFQRYRTIFGQIFPLKFQAKELISLYLKKYIQLLDEILNISKNDNESFETSETERTLEEALSFLNNNFNLMVAILKPSENIPEGPEILPLVGNNNQLKLKSYSSQVKEGIYLISESAQPLKLFPLLISENNEHFIFRTLTNEGVFFRKLSGRGFILNLSQPILIAFAEILFYLGAYQSALNFFKIAQTSDRETFISTSALVHCINAMEFLKNGEANLAASELELSLALRPEVPVLYHELTKAYISGNNLQQAASVMNKMLEKYPLSEEGYITLGDIFAQRGDWLRANRAYDKAFTLNPNHPFIAKRKNLVKENIEVKKEEKEKSETLAEDYLENLSEKIKLKTPYKIFGRQEELKTLIEILSCRDKRNVLIVGEVGVGKTFLIEEFIRRLNEDNAPPSLKGKKCFLLNSGDLIAGARYRGQLEERVIEVLKKIKNRGDLLIVENLHLLSSSSGTKGSSLDSSSLIKPYLSKGEIVIIGTTDPDSYSSIKEKDPSFLKFFHTIVLEELPNDIIKKIISDRKVIYEKFHNVVIDEEIFYNFIDLIKMSITDRKLPESILDLMDRASAAAAIERSCGFGDGIVTRDLILKTLSEMSQISYERLSRLTPERLINLEKLLSENIVGQEEAILKVARVVRACKLGFDIYPHRPDGVFMFVGPTGVGKTELAKTLAKILFGDEEKLIRIDMSEYMERISTSRLIGTSPGYVGYYDPNQLTDKIRKSPYSVVLFDEIEKADPQVLNLFLQIFDAGRLTDGRGRTVRFNHTTVIMTSNIGTDIYLKEKIGFKEEKKGYEGEKSHILKEIKKYFSPEFLNRIDEIIIFNPLTEDDIKKIIDLELKGLKERLVSEGKELILTDKAKETIAKRGYSYEFGARNLARVLRREISEPLAELALNKDWVSKSIILVDSENDKLLFHLYDREEFALIESKFIFSESEGERR